MVKVLLETALLERAARRAIMEAMASTVTSVVVGFGVLKVLKRLSYD